MCRYDRFQFIEIAELPICIFFIDYNYIIPGFGNFPRLRMLSQADS